MPSKNLHHAENPQTQNQNNAMSDDPRDGHGLTDKPEADRKKTPVDKLPEQDTQDEATLEEFGERGMGVAPKE